MNYRSKHRQTKGNASHGNNTLLTQVPEGLSIGSRYHGLGCGSCIRFALCKVRKSVPASSSYCHTGEGYDRNPDWKWTKPAAAILCLFLLACSTEPSFEPSPVHTAYSQESPDAARARDSLACAAAGLRHLETCFPDPGAPPLPSLPPEAP